jgi:hypothetical protein
MRGPPERRLRVRSMSDGATPGSTRSFDGYASRITALPG